MMEKVNKIKIVLLSSGLGHVKRGVETWAEDLGRALSQTGVNVRLYKGGGQANAAYEKVIPCIQRGSGFTRIFLRIRPGFLWRFGMGSGYSLEQLTFTLNIIPELIFKQFDIIHTQDPDIADNMRKLRRWGLIKSRVILAHGTEEPFAFLKKFDYIQHLAPHHLEEAKMNGVMNKKAFAIGNFVDTDLYKPGDRSLRKELGIPDDAFVVLSVAAIKKVHKRIDYLIDEVSAIKSSNIYLVIAGSETVETRQLMEDGKLKMGNRIVFLKNYPHEEINKVYAAADVFVLCSLKEMMPIALLEAISSGLPAIVHKYPVEEWMIGEGGESIDMAKKGELARTIEKYMNMEYRRGKGEKARRQAVDNFSKEVIVDKILRMYEEVLSA